jgi:magnesium transporter
MKVFARKSRSRRESLGMPPGSVTTTDAERPTSIEVMVYGADDFEEHPIEILPGARLSELPAEPADGVRWINVTGVHDGKLLQELGNRHGMHPLLIEDVQQPDQRPKIAPGPDTLFSVVRMISWHEETGRLDDEQVSLFSSGATVISFQQRPGDVFEEIRERIRAGTGRVRKKGADYLFYVLLDALIDSLFVTVDQLQVQIEDLEEGILESPVEAPLSEIHRIRSEVIAMRRSIWPMREMLQRASRGDFSFFAETTVPFLGDAYDHALSLVDLIDSQMDRVTGLFQLHAAMVGRSTNEVMRVLTIIATIFIPLTFVVGIYGMNFAHMPELQWRFGYPAVLALVVAIAIGMVAFFKRRRWL